MRHSTLRVISAGIVAILVPILGACSSSDQPAAPVPEKPDLTVAAVPVLDEVGLYIAADRGLFKAAGLNIRIVSITSSADAAKGQNDGAYDITAGNSVSYVQQQAEGVSNLQIIAEGSLMQPGTQALYTLPGSPITSIADLKGKRIGVNALNNIGTLLISSVLEEHGISPSSVHFVPLNFPYMGGALQRHAIDVAWLPEPFASQDESSLGLQEVTDLDQGATTDFPVGWYVCTKAWARKYPRTLAAFLQALDQGQEIADTDRAAVEQAMEKLPAPYAITPDVAALISLESYPTGPDIDRDRVQRVAATMYQLHMLTRPFHVSSMLG